MSKPKPEPQVRRPPADDDDKVTAFISGEDDETSSNSDAQTSGSPDGEQSAERKQTTVYLDADVKKKLKAFCSLEDREMSQFVNDVVAEDLEDWSPEF